MRPANSLALLIVGALYACAESMISRHESLSSSVAAAEARHAVPGGPGFQPGSGASPAEPAEPRR